MASFPPNSRIGRIRRVDSSLGPFLIARSSIFTYTILRRIDGVLVRSLSTSTCNALAGSRLERLGPVLPLTRSPSRLGFERPHDAVLVSRETGRCRQRVFWRRGETARDGSKRGGPRRLRRSYGSRVHSKRTWRELVGRPDGWRRRWKRRRWGWTPGHGHAGGKAFSDGFLWIWERLWGSWRSRWQR